jgi:tripartite-type tricarboxylate transporter receptor subunit TctC
MKFNFSTIRCSSVFMLLCCAGAVNSAHATYPDKPVRWIIPGAAGGAADSLARVVATAVSERWGQPIIIDNRPGATGLIANDAAAKAVPDGYTLGLATLSTFVVANVVAKRLPYKPAQDFTAIAMMCASPNLLSVTTSLPVKSVAELIAYAKANPNKLFYGSSGTGSALHVVTELFRLSAGIEITHTPYKSNPAAEMDLASGQIQLMIGNITSMEPHVKSGRLRALAVTGPKRSPLLPNVPTMAEAGVPAAEMMTWGGVLGPANMPAEVVQKINSEFNAALTDPKVVKRLADLGCDSAPTSLSAFSELIKTENERWGAVVKKNNITAD